MATSLSLPYVYLNTSRRAASNPDEVPLAILRARKDFAAFRWYLTKDTNLKHRTYAYQLEWLKHLQTGIDSKCLVGIAGPDTLLLAPRGSGKSSFIAEWVAYQIGVQHSPEHAHHFKVLYVSYVNDVALSKSQQIKQIITSPVYREIFPWVRQSSSWSHGQWRIDVAHAGLTEMGEPYTLCTAGLTGAVASKRAHLIVLDDLIKSPNDIKNPEVRMEMINNFNGIVYPTLIDGGRCVCAGTLMLPSDIYCTDFNEEKGWLVKTLSAIQENEKGEEVSYCEKMHSLSDLKKRRRKNFYIFSFQYQNVIAKATDEELIDPELIVKKELPESFDRIAVGMDLSTSEKQRADWTVLILVGKKDDKYYILDMRRGRYPGNIDKCDALLLMLMAWGFIQTDTPYEVKGYRIEWASQPVWKYTGVEIDFYPEKAGYQKSLEADFDRYIGDQLGQDWISCEPISVPGDKRQKFLSLTGVFQLRMIFFNRYRVFTHLVTELTTPSIHDDCVDGLATALFGLGLVGDLSFGEIG